MKIVYSQNCTLFRKYFIIVKSRQLSQRKAVCFLFASAIVGEEKSTSPQKRKKGVKKSTPIYLNTNPNVHRNGGRKASSSTSLDTLIHLLVTCRKQDLRSGKHVII